MLFKSGFNSGALFFVPAVCVFCQFYLKQYTYEDGQCPRLFFLCLIIDVFNNRCHGCQGDGSFDNLTGCHCPGVRGTVLFPGHG